MNAYSQNSEKKKASDCSIGKVVRKEGLESVTLTEYTEGKSTAENSE